MNKILVYIALAVALSSAAFGQKPNHEPKAQQETRSTNKEQASESSALIKSGTMIEGQLQSTVDVTKSKVGDEVVLKTTKAIKQNGETVIPKGSRLVGRVSEVQEKTKSNGASKLGLLFERLEGKNLAVPVSASIVSITNVASNNRLADSADLDLLASSNSTAQVSGGSSGRSSGGLLGGAANTVGSVASTGGGLVNTSTRAVGSVTNSVGHTVGSASGAVFRTIDGLTISNSAAGSVSAGSTLSAANRNIKLEKGVKIGLELNSSTTSP